MPKLQNVNWEDLAKGNAIEPGRYPVRIDDVKDKTSKAGNAMWEIELTITDGPATGRKLWATIMMQPNALWKLRQLLEAIGLEKAGTDDLDTEELKDCELLVDVINEDYEGQISNRVKKFVKLS
jgi:hypothetical protein